MRVPSVLLLMVCVLSSCESFPSGKWVSLLDGKSPGSWRVADTDDFEAHGPVIFENGSVELGRGRLMTGIVWTSDLPRDNYEITLDGMRVEGGDFFCGLTFPVGESPCTLILGGWGGSVVGLSNVDDYSADDNSTSSSFAFDNGQWYAIRLRVTPERIEAWIDDDSIVNQPRAGHDFSIWWEQELMQPLGIATYDTKASLRNIRLRRLP